MVKSLRVFLLEFFFKYPNSPLKKIKLGQNNDTKFFSFSVYLHNLQGINRYKQLNIYFIKIKNEHSKGGEPPSN